MQERMRRGRRGAHRVLGPEQHPAPGPRRRQHVRRPLVRTNHQPSGLGDEGPEGQQAPHLPSFVAQHRHSCGSGDLPFVRAGEPEPRPVRRRQQFGDPVWPQGPRVAWIAADHHAERSRRVEAERQQPPALGRHFVVAGLQPRQLERRVGCHARDEVERHARRMRRSRTIHRAPEQPAARWFLPPRPADPEHHARPGTARHQGTLPVALQVDGEVGTLGPQRPPQPPERLQAATPRERHDVGQSRQPVEQRHERFLRHEHEAPRRPRPMQRGHGPERLHDVAHRRQPHQQDDRHRRPTRSASTNDLNGRLTRTRST